MREHEAIGLAEALEAIRSELESAQAAALGRSFQFSIKSLTLELMGGVTRSTEGRAGFKVPLLGAELGGSVGRSNESMQTITLVLEAPLDQSGKSVLVASSQHVEMD